MKKSGYLTFVALLFVFCIFCGPLKLYFRGAVFFATFLTFGYMLTIAPQLLFGKATFLAALLFCIKIGTDIIFGGTLTTNSAYKYTCDIILMPIVSYGLLTLFLKNGDYRSFKRYTMVSCLILLVFVLATIRADVGASRNSITQAMQYSVSAVIDAYEDAKTGVLGYQSIHALPFLIPGLVMLYKNGWNAAVKWGSAIYAGLLMLAIVRSGFTMASIVALLVLLFCMVRTSGRSSSQFILICTLVLVLLAWKCGFIASGLKMILMETTERNAITSKMSEIVAVYEKEERGSSDANSRIDMIKVVTKAFVKHPVFGHSFNEEGACGHNYILDYLAQYGMFGFFFFWYYYYFVFKSVKTVMPKSMYWHYNLAFVALIVMLCLKAQALKVQNVVGFLMLPSLLLYGEEAFYFASNRVRARFGLPPVKGEFYGDDI